MGHTKGCRLGWKLLEPEPGIGQDFSQGPSRVTALVSGAVAGAQPKLGVSWGVLRDRILLGLQAGVGRLVRVTGAFQSSASVLGLRVSKFLCTPFKIGVLISYSPPALPVISPAGF